MEKRSKIGKRDGGFIGCNTNYGKLPSILDKITNLKRNINILFIIFHISKVVKILFVFGAKTDGL